MMALEGGSVGFQIGGQATECSGGVPVFSAGVSACCPKAAVQAVSASAVAIVYILILLPRNNPIENGRTRNPS